MSVAKRIGSDIRMNRDMVYRKALEMLETTNVYNKDISDFKYGIGEREKSLLDIIKRKLQFYLDEYRRRRIEDLAYDVIVYSMEEYIEEYPGTVAFIQHTKGKFRSWLKAIEEKYEVDSSGMDIEFIEEKEVNDIGIAMIKALHKREGMNKLELGDELGLKSRAVEKYLRKICPKLYKGKNIDKTGMYTPYRIGGYPLTADIKVIRKKDRREYYITVNTVHPIVLQENLMQLGTLLKSLSYSYHKDKNNTSVIIGIDIWSQLSEYAKERLKNNYAIADNDLLKFLEKIENDFPGDDYSIKYCTEREMMLDENMSIAERIMFLTKVKDRTCTLKIHDKVYGNDIVLNRQCIKYSGSSKLYIAESEDGSEYFFELDDVKSIEIDN